MTIICSCLKPAYKKSKDRIKSLVVLFQLWREHRRTLRNQSEPEPLPPRSRLLRQWLKEAQKEYTLEAKLITGTADLEDDERQALMLAAKQRYIQKMNRILQ